MAVAYRIYARALFDAAKDRDRLARVREDLGDFVAMVDEVPELRALLRDPVLDPKEKADALDSILGGVDELVRNFLLLVAEKNRTGQIEEIAHEFDRLVAAEERRLEVELTTAFELSDQEAKSIVAQIEKASGRQVDATRSVDPELIGGLILQAGSMRVDASVRGRLNRLRQDLVTRS
ncbi:MAG: ATP synthase F1 subunit delta [Thermoleophilia bacterium]